METILESTSFSDATVMVEACHTELTRAGFQREASLLHGVEVHSIKSALSALTMLEAIQPTSNDLVDSTVRYTKMAVRNLLAQELVARAN